MLAGMRYVLLLLAVLTAFFMPMPLGAMGAQGQLIATIDRFAWLCMVVLVLAAALVVLAIPRRRWRLFAAAGATGILFGIGRLDLVLAGSGIWMLLLAGLTWLFLRLEHLAPTRRIAHVPGPRRPPNGGIGTLAVQHSASADSLPKASAKSRVGAAIVVRHQAGAGVLRDRLRVRVPALARALADRPRSDRSVPFGRRRPAAERRLPFLGRNISTRNSSINVDSAALTWDNRGLIIYAVCDQDRPSPETDTNARTGGRAPVLHD